MKEPPIAHRTAGNPNNTVQNVVMHRSFDPRLTAGKSYSKQCAEGRILQRLALLNQNNITLQFYTKRPMLASDEGTSTSSCVQTRCRPICPGPTFQSTLQSRMAWFSRSLAKYSFELLALLVLSTFVVLRWTYVGRAGRAARPPRWIRSDGLWNANEACTVTDVV